MKEKEIFLPILGFENYCVSNFGNVKNVKTGRLLKPQKNRYSTIGLNKNNKRVTCSIHRLVANAFIPNPNNYLTVNHINKNTHDNKINNLEWCTQKEQNIYNYKTENTKRTTSRARSIICMSLNGEVLFTFRTLTDAANWLFDKGTSISLMSCLSGIRNSAKKNGICHGYKWKYNDIAEINLEKEVWVELPLHLTLNKSNYMISNMGRFKNNKNKLIIQKPTNDYIAITIRSYNQTKRHMLHRLVAELFVTNPQNKSYVNHIDGTKHNNKADNLEWVTKSENTMHAHKTGLINSYCRKINQYDKFGNFIRQFNSIRFAADTLKLDRSSIGHVCAKDRPGSNTCGGFIFKYAN